MNWKKVIAGVSRYGLVYAGMTVLMVGLATQSELAVAALFIFGLVLLLFVFGVGNVRTGELSTVGGEQNVNNQLADAHIDHHQYVSADQKLFFYGLGLATLGFGAMVVLGG